jgi:hypothetical protein
MSLLVLSFFRRKKAQYIDDDILQFLRKQTSLCFFLCLCFPPFSLFRRIATNFVCSPKTCYCKRRQSGVLQFSFSQNERTNKRTDGETNKGTHGQTNKTNERRTDGWVQTNQVLCSTREMYCQKCTPLKIATFFFFFFILQKWIFEPASLPHKCIRELFLKYYISCDYAIIANWWLFKCCLIFYMQCLAGCVMPRVFFLKLLNVAVLTILTIQNCVFHSLSLCVLDT